MATSGIKGENFAVEGSSITFFGSKGAVIDADSWGVNAFGGDTLVQVGKGSWKSIIPTIQMCIASDVADGNDDKIAMVVMAPMAGVIFFLEGGITRDDFARANGCAEYVDIPGVVFEGRTFTVRVLKDAEYPAATADVEGNIL